MYEFVLMMLLKVLFLLKFNIVKTFMYFKLKYKLNKLRYLFENWV